ncbi:MAG: LysM peptidoglycan-binding domain-containing protein [Clostridiales bacterium]|nr:LysM peptidoglycan-binding domain-containing protein [Clostridiales bacterium]
MISNPYHSGYVCLHNCDNWVDYTIQEKDTLYNISVRFGVPIRMLMTCNRLLNPYNLQIGQVIKVPASKPELLCCQDEDEETYVVQLKDTLYSIAEKHNTSVEAILAKNPGIDPYNLKPGAPICVPKKQENNNMITAPETPSVPQPENMPMLTPEPRINMNSGNSMPMQEDPAGMNCDGKYYTVKSGDTLESILDAFDYTYASMAFANPNVDLYNLSEGMKICVPLYDMFKGCNSGTTYIVRNGDTLSSLSVRFGVTQAELMSANPFMRSRDFTTAGSRICIPE